MKTRFLVLAGLLINGLVICLDSNDLSNGNTYTKVKNNQDKTNNDLVLRVPRKANKGDDITLSIEHSFDNASIYSIKWYYQEQANGSITEFFRYTPRDRPAKHVLPHRGFAVDYEGSDQNNVHINVYEANVLAYYITCEVSLEDTFQTHRVEQYMDLSGRDELTTPEPKPKHRLPHKRKIGPNDHNEDTFDQNANVLLPCAQGSKSQAEQLMTKLLNNDPMDRLECESDLDIDLKNVMAVVSQYQKHFKTLVLSNPNIKTIEANAFSETTFDEIYIEDCIQLQSIHEMAFNGTQTVTKRLVIRDNPVLSSPDNSIYKIINRFIRIESVSLIRNNYTDIPDRAFGPLDKLTNLTFSSIKFTKLGSFAFAKLKNLEHLNFGANDFKIIPDNAFAFDRASSKQWNINFLEIFSNPRGREEMFRPGSLVNIRRPTTITFLGGSYLLEFFWDDFLKENERNKIDLGDTYIKCSSCGEVLEENYGSLLTRIINLKCVDRLLSRVHKKQYQYCIL